MFELPLFPLNTVLFPGMPLQLTVFEQRYRLMMQRVLSTNHTFGVSLIRSGEEALGPLPQPFEVGCTARVISVEPAQDGRLNLTVVGDERYRIVRLAASEPYLTAFVETLPLDLQPATVVEHGARALRPLIRQYLVLLASRLRGAPDEAADPGAPGGEPAADGLAGLDAAALQLPEDPLMMIYMAAALLQVPAQEKQPLLEAPSASEMLEAVRRMYRRELAILPSLFAADDDEVLRLAREN